MVEKSLKKFYGGAVKFEWKRVVMSPYARLEHDTTLHFLEKYLPKKGLILDAGGGPGRYTIELAKKGYDVVLNDITPENLEFARKQIKRAKVQGNVKGVIEGSITDLSVFKNNTFDAVLCLGGPLSHVSGKKNRDKAISELIRVAKKGAPLFVSVMGRPAMLAGSLRYWRHEIRLGNFLKMARTGDDSLWQNKYYCHEFLLDEFKDAFKDKNVDVLQLIGLEGLASHSQKEFNKLAKTNKKGYVNWLKMHYLLCTEPTVVGISEHILIVCKKK